MQSKIIPKTGFLRLKQILQFIPVGETTWRVGVKEGHFPQSVRVANRVNLWRVEDIRDLIASYNNQPYTNKVYNKKPYEQMEFGFNKSKHEVTNNE